MSYFNCVLMKKSFSQFIIFFLLLPLLSFCQNQSTPAEKFIAFLNNYQKDSLNDLLADDFELQRTYSSYSNNKKTFLEDYISSSKAYHGKYKILKVMSNVEPQQFLVEDHSDYLQYLKIEKPKWIMTFFSDKNKINRLNIDSTISYSQFTEDLKKKSIAFDSWVKEKHPEINPNSITKTEGLFMKLLKEYCKENN
jgi:hypothetical protein